MADHVVLATGSTVAALPAAVQARGGVTVESVLTGGLPEEPGVAVVYDEADGFWPAYSAAEALAQRGWQVTFATALTALASRVPAESAGPLLQRLGAAGVSLRVAHHVVLPDDPAEPIALRPVFGGADVEVGPALLVWHQQRVGADTLLSAGEPGEDLTVIGDGITPRRISHAIAEGYRFGATV
jgi:2,4-dienoyl-CoA reductase (NADPH2)